MLHSPIKSQTMLYKLTLNVMCTVEACTKTGNTWVMNFPGLHDECVMFVAYYDMIRTFKNRVM